MSCATPLRWPTAMPRAVSVRHGNGVAPARVWLPSIRPTTLLKILCKHITTSGCCPCMLVSRRFNWRWSGRCMGGAVPDCRDRPRWISWLYYSWIAVKQQTLGWSITSLSSCYQYDMSALQITVYKKCSYLEKHAFSGHYFTRRSPVRSVANWPRIPFLAWLPSH